jgi:hypothetical protein
MHTHDDWTSIYKAAGLTQGICELRLLWSSLQGFGFILPDLGQAMGGETSSLMSGQLPSEERWKQIGLAVCNDPEADAAAIVLKISEAQN